MTEQTEATDTAGYPPEKPRVALFVTCLVDLFRPSVAHASIALLEDAGCEVVVPTMQTCCGQPAYNTGDYAAAVTLAKATITAMEGADYVVAPSGSCAGMLRLHYARLLEDDWRKEAQALAEKTFELTQFLTNVMNVTQSSNLPTSASGASGIVTYHDSCAGLRELGVARQPRQLLKHISGVDIVEMQDTSACCGFGGTFCAKMPAISAEMADAKLAQVEQTGATLLTGGDLGCLMQLAGRAHRTGQPIEARHVAEILAGALDEPGIGDSQP